MSINYDNAELLGPIHPRPPFYQSTTLFIHGPKIEGRRWQRQIPSCCTNMLAQHGGTRHYLPLPLTSLYLGAVDGVGSLPLHPENLSNASNLPTIALVRSVFVPQPAWLDHPWACLSTPKTFLARAIFQRLHWLEASSCLSPPGRTTPGLASPPRRPF